MTQLMMSRIFSLVLLVIGATYSSCKQAEEIFKVPNIYPHFSQCDSQWKNDIVEIKTVCQVGCLISSVSMALNYYHITIGHQPVNPGTLNAWLRANNGYSGDDLEEVSLERLSPNIKYIGMVEKMTSNQTIDYLNTGIVTIAHVRNGTHFVLIAGYTTSPSQNWLVNDPYYNQTIYTTTEIVNYRIFNIK